MESGKKYIGEAVHRIDGLLKVTGAASYALDFPLPNPLHGFLIKSETAAGKILSIDTAAAEKASGVVAVITHRNALKVTPARGLRGGAMLQDDSIEYWGENIGVVVAETYEQARAAARLVKVDYGKAAAKTDFEREKASARKPRDREDVARGAFDDAFAAAEVKLDQTYVTPIEHHQPMAPHATVAVWEADDRLTLYNESQVVGGVQNALAAVFGLQPENVRVVTPHIGGGFGSKGGAWGHVVIAAIAAKMTKRPVKLGLTRQMLFTSVGLRQKNIQRLRLAATRDGRLTGIAHETVTHAAINEEFVEGCGDVSQIMYAAPNLKVNYRLAPMNVIVPTFTRAPGKAPGSFALESALDELAHQLKIDPVELRLKNEPPQDPANGKPFSSRALVDCLKQGAEKFGWSRRRMEPRAVRRNGWLVGYGVGCGTYPARQRDTSALVKLAKTGDDVRATVELAASDLGTGTYTILAQTAAEVLGLPINRIAVKIGDSSLPPAAGSVGSVGASSFANAVNEACEKALTELQAKSNRQWFAAPSVAQLMEAADLTEFQTRVDAKPPANAADYSSHSFNANFAEVWVNEATGMTLVKRLVAATDAGRILNPRTAESQVIGGAIWGIGQALHEESLIDPRWGNFVTRSYADYHIPANLDVGAIESIFVLTEDKIVNKMGIKGIGEVGIVGVAAAVANAVFNATGKRVRELPITPDKLI